MYRIHIHILFIPVIPWPGHAARQGRLSILLERYFTLRLVWAPRRVR